MKWKLVQNREEAKPGRILAVDLGERRIGLAVSDELGLTAQGLPTLIRTSLREDLERLAELARSHGVRLVLFGNPVNMNGSEGRRTAWVKEFAQKLQDRHGCEVRLWDERLTTRQAERVLRASGISRQKRGHAVDRLAAVLLLQSYLEANGATGNGGGEAR
ncbi:MAG: Holliday junction resolvase RuvX [Bryobacteraceae bacterium]|nr:Holliday junction resolvase RuvX [Bryobacteraceae bacterium]